jgi:transcriptional regulator with XRE-family HTH domain
MKTNRSNILDNIIAIRKKKGFSQDYLASRIGMKQAGYGLIEQGKRGLEYNVLLQIAVEFKMDVVDIITYPNKNINSESLLNSLVVAEDKVTLSIEMKKTKSEQVLRLAFGENNLEISNK